MNKICRRIVCLLLVLMSVSGIGASPGRRQSSFDWYTVKAEDHKTPPPPPEFVALGQRQAIYVDQSAAAANKKVVYLTFDAGYENGNVEKILDVLKEENVEAAFFVLSNLAQKNSGLLVRMSQEGHLICNHTSKHKDMTRLSKEEFLLELKKLEEQVSEHTGCSVAPFYRPPEGRYSAENLAWAEEAGYTTVFWSLCYADWDNDRQLKPESAMKILCDHVHPGAIVLLHPTSSTNAAILKELIVQWKADGYELARIDKIKP